MKYACTLTLALSLALTGCGKEKSAAPAPVAPAHQANDNSGTAGDPSNANRGAASGGTSGKQPVAVGTSASGNTAPKPKPAEAAPFMTQEQYDKIDVHTTLEDLNRTIGAPGKLVADTGDRKTYQYRLKNKSNYYINVVFNKGQYLEKSIFTM